MSVIVFDVNETLSDMAPLAKRFADCGAPESLAATWFASTLRDGDALSMTGTPRPFADVARAVLRTLWSAHSLSGADAAADHVLEGFTSLDVHPDVVAGVESLAAAGHRLVTLSNGAVSVAESLLERAGVRDRFDALLSVDDGPAAVWKPDPRAYRHAVDSAGADAGDLVLVAVHPWDLHGANAAGLRTAWIDRSSAPWPALFTAPDVRVAGLDDLAAVL